MPQGAVNEIHGAFFDPSNPGGFELRGDLVEDMFEWAAQTDLCLALGTSLSGLNADRMARTPAEKYSPERIASGPGRGVQRKRTFGCLGSGRDVRRRETLGLVIVSVQETQLDKLATLRIFALLDDVMQLLAEELQLPAAPCLPPACPSEVPDVFSGLPYNAAGQFCPSVSSNLDLRLGTPIKITKGNFKGCLGVVAGKNPEGHYLLKVTMDVGGGACIGEDLLLGSWWLREAKNGLISTLPVVQPA